MARMVDRGVACDDSANRSDTMDKEAGQDSPNVIRFFKIMFGKNFWKYLPLPPKFARLVEKLADQDFQLEDSSGLQWPVKLAEVDGSLSFHKGWKRFFMDHGLKEGQLLVFEYTDGGHFIVHVFGQSAMEITNIDNVGPRNCKQVKTNTHPESLSQDNLFPTENVQLREELGPNDSVALGLESRPQEPCPKEGDGDMMRLADKLTTVVTEDMIGMIDRDDRCYGREGRDILYDLSCFEMGKKTPASCDAVITDKINEDSDGNQAKMTAGSADRVNECVNDVDRFENDLGVNENFSHPHDNMGPPKTKVANDTNETKVANDTNEICIEKFKKPLDICADPSHIAQKKVDVHRNAGEKFARTFEKDTDRLRNPSPAVKRDDGKLKRDARAANRVEKNNVSVGDVLSDKYHIKRRNNGNLRKKAREDVSNPPNDCHERRISGKRKCPESAIPYEIPKKMFGERPTRKERFEPRGKAPATREDDQIFFPPVKAEPNLPDEPGPSGDLSQFSAKVKSKSYLELPVQIPSIPGKRDRGQGKVVYIRDSSGRIWPMFNPNRFATKALVGKWTIFCEANIIKLGDECRFQLENEKTCCYKVDVMHQ